MNRSVKIRAVIPPQPPLSNFDPGKYVTDLDFYETDESITENDRDGLAQFIHFLAFLALKSGSARWEDSVIPNTSSAYQAICAYFGTLLGWRELVAENADISYPQLVGFLMDHYPPALPPSRTE